MNNKPYKILNIDQDKNHITVGFTIDGKKYLDTRCDLALKPGEELRPKLDENGQVIINKKTQEVETILTVIPVREHIHGQIMAWYNDLKRGIQSEKEKKTEEDLSDLIEK